MRIASLGWATSLRSTAITLSGRGRQESVAPATEIVVRKPLVISGKGFPF